MNNIFQRGKKATLVAGSGTLFFAIAKGIVGSLSGSVVLLADAVHSGADALSTFLAWVGLKIAQKKPTEKFPFGFYKAENITAFIISFLIFFAGFHVAQESWSKLSTSYELSIPYIAIGLAALDGMIMFLIGSYELKAGREINSQSLMADGKESRLHLLSSSVVLIGLLGAFFNWPYIEGIAGLVIALFVFQAGFESLRDSAFALMDVSPSEEVEEKVQHTLGSISGIQGFNDLKLRKSGPFVFGTVKIKMGRSIDVKRASEVSEKVEQKVREDVSLIDSFTAHITSSKSGKRKVCIPIGEDQDLQSELSSQFGRAEKFAFIQTQSGQIEDYYIKDNPYQQKEVRAGLRVSQWMMKERVDGVIVKEIGPIALHTLRDNIVEVYKGGEGTVKTVTENLLQDKLEILKTPTREKT